MPKTTPVITDNETLAANEAEQNIPSVISINGVDYDPAEAQALIETGTRTRDLEKQWNTSVDKVWPEYGKSQETLKKYEAELAEAKAQLTEFQSKQNAGVDQTPADFKEAREAAKKLGIVLDEDLTNSGYVKKEDLYKEFETYSQQQAAIKQVLDTADGLVKEIDGSDGRPPFNKKVVLAYASAYNIPDLKAAYEDMHKDQLDSWKSAQVASQRKPGLKTLDSGGAKAVTPGKVDDSNKSDRLKEALWGNNNE